MSIPISLTELFRSVGLTYGPMLPLLTLFALALLVLPALSRPGTHAQSVVYATYCYIGQMIGILLMSSGALPALYAVGAKQPLAESTYTGLLIVFAVGGALFLWHDVRVRAVDSDSRALPAALFHGTWKLIGLLVTVFACISIGLNALNASSVVAVSLAQPLVMLLYGLVLLWFTIERRPSAQTAPRVQQQPVRPSPTLIAKKTQATPSAPSPASKKPAKRLKKA